MTARIAEARSAQPEARRPGTRPLRVLHAPLAAGGHGARLAAAERECGLDSVSVAFEAAADAAFDEVLFAGVHGRLEREFRRARLLRRAMREFDVVHFNFGSSLLPQRVPASSIRRPAALPLELAYRAYAALLEQRDLPLLRRAGRAIFVTYQGYDARQGDYCLAHFEHSPAHEAEAGYYPPAADEHKRARIRRADRVADGIYAVTPDLLHVLPPRASFLPTPRVDPRSWPAADPPSERGTAVVVHAPSRRDVKGTRHITAAVEALREEGTAVELRLAEGLPSTRVRELYADADVVVDQLLCGWYGAVGVEAMATARPVVAYIRPEDLAFVPAELRAELPVVDASPETIRDVLRALLTTRRAELPELGRRSRAFVERWHHPLVIARRLRADYERAVDRIRAAA